VHDGVLDSFLLGNHCSHSTILLLDGFSKEIYFVGLGGSLLGQIVDVFLLDRDSTGFGSHLGDLLLE